MKNFTMDLYKTEAVNTEYENYVLEEMVSELLEENPSLNSEKAYEIATSELSDNVNSERFLYLEQLAMQNMMDSAVETLKDIITNYEKRYNTSVEYIAWQGERSSHYGAIGGNGASCVAVKEYDPKSSSLEDFIVFGDYDTSLIVETGKGGGVELSVSDHDGTNYTKLVLITESMIDKKDPSAYYREEIAEEIAFEKKPLNVSSNMINS